MNEKKRRLLERGKRDVTKAGKMFLDAVFGDTEDFFDALGNKGEDEACDDDAITVEGYATEEEPAPSTKPYGSDP
jgi:hypothetical protein